MGAGREGEEREEEASEHSSSHAERVTLEGRCPGGLLCWQGAWRGHRQWQVAKGHRAGALLLYSVCKVGATSAALLTVLE